MPLPTDLINNPIIIIVNPIAISSSGKAKLKMTPKVEETIIDGIANVAIL